jgi:hypothetical protein
VPASNIDPIRSEPPALLPHREDTHPLGCHNPPTADTAVFDKHGEVLVPGMGYARAADGTCSATTLRPHRDEWTKAGAIGHLVIAVLRAYDRMADLEPDDPAADGCTTNAPSGGECAARPPADPGKQGIKRPQLTEADSRGRRNINWLPVQPRLPP